MSPNSLVKSGAESLKLVPAPLDGAPQPAAPGFPAGAMFRHEQQEIQFAISQSIHSASPLPDPAVLRGLEDIQQGTMDRLLTMAERQQAHRHSLESKNLGADVNRAYLGVASALVISLVCVVGGFIVINNGHDSAGTVVVGTSLASLVGVFIYGTLARRAERQQKTERIVPAHPGIQLPAAL